MISSASVAATCRSASRSACTCILELGQPHPDYQAAQLYATLSLEEALRDMIAQLAQVTRELSVVARRR